MNRVLGVLLSIWLVSNAAVVHAKDKQPDLAELMVPGLLSDIVLGNADAPNVIIEYASMTCPHCAQFQKDVFPALKAKYIDTGKAKYMLREFPLDNLAVAAFMLARCSGNDRYYPMVDAMFSTQENWAAPGVDAKDKLLQIARQAGISKDQFDQCLADKELFNKIVQVRKRANEKFGVDSTPTFFVNGKKLTGDHQLKDFDAALGSEASASSPARVQ
jgi:protein-disulfide isomerase